MHELPCQKSYRFFLSLGIVPKFTAIFTIITLLFSLLMAFNVLNQARLNFEDTLNSRSHCFTKFLQRSIDHITQVKAEESDQLEQIMALLYDAKNSGSELYRKTEFTNNCQRPNGSVKKHSLSFFPTSPPMLTTCFVVKGKTYKNYFSAESYQKKFYRLEKKILLFLSFGFLVYIVVVYAVFRKILTPISCLANEMKNVSLATECDLSSFAKSHGNDEIYQLFRAYCEMLNQLRTMHEKQLQTNRILIEAEKFVTVGQLVAGLAHEINNPLGGMKNCLYNLKKHENDNKKIKYLNLMENGVDLISNLIQRLLNLTNAPSNAFSSVNLKQALEESLEFLKSQLISNQITLSVKAPDELFINSNKYSLIQVFLNLAINAIDSLKEKDTTTEKILSVTIEVETENIVISFFDNGCGIDAATQEKIFAPFFTTKPSGSGNGLGLFIVDGIVSAMNYSIALNSEYGEWTKFTIMIPTPKK